LLAKLRGDFQEAGLAPDDWQTMSLQFAGGVDGVIAKRLAALDVAIKHMVEGDPARPVAYATAPLSAWPLNVLKAERDKVNGEVGIDKQRQARYEGLRRTLDKDERALQRVTADLENAKGASDRKQGLIETRRQLYEEVFATYLEEQQVLMRLYGPLQELLTTTAPRPLGVETTARMIKSRCSSTATQPNLLKRIRLES
jgi:hypothetical protein